MKTKEELKDLVRAKYNQIALQTRSENKTSCCGATGCCESVDYTIFSDDYTKLQGYAPDADLGLGCGIPTQFAMIRPGNTVIDLGSGAGNDAFVARALTGAEGRVIGLDFAGAMLTKARLNAASLGYTNVSFVKGDIEQMPFEDHLADVVLSNCVLNLVPDKEKAFQEIHRVLKPGGHFCISDVVTGGDLPEALLRSAEMYAGCVAGAIKKDEYLQIIRNVGFSEIQIRKEKVIIIPDEIMAQYLDQESLQRFSHQGSGIMSITVTGVKR
ncbi:MAG TPA: arsenite methyltransferase [Bacteroidales bacterium]|nr:arsenite methyltransferase [Bacteroidales bacterium]HRZ47999.1 arsenite methyltransferase [Bacteroidales bacterium]